MCSKVEPSNNATEINMIETIAGFNKAQERWERQEPAYYSDDGGEKKATEIKARVTTKGSEYFAFDGANLWEAISESCYDKEFETKLGQAVQTNDAQALLALIKAQSMKYWTEYLDGIVE
jgi:hypothetical protein